MPGNMDVNSQVSSSFQYGQNDQLAAEKANQSSGSQSTNATGKRKWGADVDTMNSSGKPSKKLRNGAHKDATPTPPTTNTVPVNGASGNPWLDAGPLVAFIMTYIECLDVQQRTALVSNAVTINQMGLIGSESQMIAGIQEEEGQQEANEYYAQAGQAFGSAFLDFASAAVTIAIAMGGTAKGAETTDENVITDENAKPTDNNEMKTDENWDHLNSVDENTGGTETTNLSKTETEETQTLNGTSKGKKATVEVKKESEQATEVEVQKGVKKDDVEKDDKLKTKNKKEDDKKTRGQKFKEYWGKMGEGFQKNTAFIQTSQALFGGGKELVQGSVDVHIADIKKQEAYYKGQEQIWQGFLKITEKMMGTGDEAFRASIDMIGQLLQGLGKMQDENIKSFGYSRG